MPRRKKKESGGGRSIDLTSFLSGAQGEAAKPKATAKEAVETKPEAPPLLEEAVEIVYSYVKSFPGGVGKTELYHWAKSKGIKPAELYRAILKLVSEGRVKRVFDPEKEEYVYVAA